MEIYTNRKMLKRVISRYVECMSDEELFRTLDDLEVVPCHLFGCTLCEQRFGTCQEDGEKECFEKFRIWCDEKA